MKGIFGSWVVWHELLHQRYRFVGFVQLGLIVEDVDCLQVLGIAGDIMFGDEVVDCNHAIVFELGDFGGVVLADGVDVVEEGAVGGAFCVATCG